MTSRDDIRGDVREFLVSRRAKVSPEQAGIVGGSNRRVPGLRRSEVAMLADVSVEYYARLERGNVSGVSDSVLESIAQALQLDEAERTHLQQLVRLAGSARSPRRQSARQQVRPVVHRVLEALVDAPAFVENGRLDLLALNPLADALYAPVVEMGHVPPNNARFTFLDPSAPDFFRDWEKAANDVVALLRAEAGRFPYDSDLSMLIGELSTRSDEFRVRWGAHDVRIHSSGSKRVHHPVVGDIDLDYESFPLPGDPGQSMVVYTAEPGSASADALRLLASWAASQPADGAQVAVVDRPEHRSSVPESNE